jgi:Flp pilus assembly protein TadD
VAAAGVCLFSCATKTAGINSAVKQPPSFSATPTRQTVNAVDAGDEDLQIAALRRTVTSHPDDVNSRLKLAQAYAAHGFPDVALEHYRLASERFPESSEAAVLLARALRQAGENSAALTGLKSFLHAHPQQTAEPYEWLGILNDDAKNWSDAELAYSTALLYSPSDAALHNNLGYAMLMQFRYQDAAREFRTALKLQHDLVIARNNLGIALAGAPGGDKDKKEAILNWQAVSGPAAAHNNMAALLMEHGKYAEARKELETALGYDRQNTQALYNLTLVSAADGKPALLPGVVPVRKPSVAGFTKHVSLLVAGKIRHPRRPKARPAENQTVAVGQAAR